MKAIRYLTVLIVLLSMPLYGTPLKIAVSVYDPPFVLQEAQGHFHGFDIAMMQYVCKELKRPCQFVPILDRHLLGAVEHGEANVAASSILISVSRANQVNFSSPYLASKVRFVSLRKVGQQSSEIATFSKKKIGMADKALAEQIEQLGTLNAKIILFKQHDTLVQALLRKKIDFALMPHHIAEHWHLHSAGLIQFVGEPLYLGLGVAVAVNRKDIKLLSDINIALFHYQASNEFKKDFETYLLTY